MGYSTVHAGTTRLTPRNPNYPRRRAASIQAIASSFMSTPVRPEIFACVSLLSSAQGGRAGPILHGEYRGVLQLPKEAFSFRTFIESDSGLAPGHSAEIGIQFLVPELALPLLSEGTEFSVWEGKLIGNGRVTRVCANG